DAERVGAAEGGDGEQEEEQRIPVVRAQARELGGGGGLGDQQPAPPEQGADDGHYEKDGGCDDGAFGGDGDVDAGEERLELAHLLALVCDQEERIGHTGDV